MHLKDTIALIIGVPLLAAAGYMGYLLATAPDPQAGRVAVVVPDGAAPAVPYLVPSLSTLFAAAAEAHALGDTESTVLAISAAQAQLTADLAAANITLDERGTEAMNRLNHLARHPAELPELETSELRRLLGVVHASLARLHAARAADRTAPVDMALRDEALRATAHHLRRAAEYQSDGAREAVDELRLQVQDTLRAANAAATSAAGDAAVQSRQLLGRLEKDLRQLESRLEERLGIERPQ